MVRLESTALPHTFSIFLWKPALHDDRRCAADSKFNSPNNGNSRAAPYSRGTPHNYTIQLCNSISIQTCTTHTQGGSLSDPLSYQGCGKRCQIKNRKMWRDFRGLRMKWWARQHAWKGFDQGHNVKQLREVKKKCSKRMWRDQKLMQEQAFSVQEHKSWWGCAWLVSYSIKRWYPVSTRNTLLYGCTC